METISFCGTDDLKPLQNFINEKWKENHILSTNKCLFDFQHKANNGYNFVISKNEYNEITGILGFITLSTYDEGLKPSKDIWLAIWKVDTDKAKPGIGFSLLKWLEKALKPTSIGAIGINSEVKKIYDILGFHTGVLKQYFIINKSISKYEIIDLKDDTIPIQIDTSNSCLKEISINDLQFIDYLFNPLKSWVYLQNRYTNHPYYKYLLFGAYTGEALKAVFVVRKICINGKYCMRIVDIQGSLFELESLNQSFQSILIEHNSEYIDCLNYGLSDKLFFQLGFMLRNSDIIIPNYFEPFIKDNVDILFAYKSIKPDYIIFKGDSDQDRPNI